MNRAVWLMCGALLAAVPAAAVKVQVDYDRAVDFSRYQTFAWKPGTPAQSEITQQRIVSAIEEQLAARGLQPASGEPDLWVDAHAMTETEIRSSGVSVGLGFHKRTKRGGISVGGSSGGRARSVNVGTLIIDLLDGGSEELVWRGVAKSTLRGSPEETGNKIREAAAKTFKDFPPSERP